MKRTGKREGNDNKRWWAVFGHRGPPLVVIRIAVFFGNSRVNPPKWKNGSLARLFYPEKHVHGFPFILFSAFFTLLFLPIPQQRPEQAKQTKRAKFIDRILFAFFYISFWRSEIMLRAWNRRRAWILSCWIHGQWPNSLSIILTVTYGRVLSSSRPASCCGVSFDCGWHSRSIYFCAFFTLFFWCGVVRWHKHKIKTNHTASLVVKARFNRR